MGFAKGYTPWNKGLKTGPRSSEIGAKIRQAKLGQPREDMRGVGNPRWGGETVGYSGAHRRLYALRGAAASHVCELCEERPAQHWALRHDQGVNGPLLDSAGLAYSMNPDDYLPACVLCHSRFDRESA